MYNEEKHDDNALKSVKEKSGTLFEKYIEWGSEYEVILQYKTREKIIDVMSHPDWIDDNEIGIDDIMELWNDVSKELFVLLENSFSRFRTTQQYQKLLLENSLPMLSCNFHVD